MPRSKTSPNSSSISRRMRSKLANRSRSGTPQGYPPPGGSDELCARPHEAGVDRHRLLGRLTEVEALAQVDPQVGHGLELVHALDALGDDLAAVLVGAVHQGRHEAAAGRRVLDARGQ